MKLLDEYDDLNKNFENLKSSYAELEKEFEKFKDESEHKTYRINYTNRILKDMNSFYKLTIRALEDNRIPPKLEDFTNPKYYPKFMKSLRRQTQGRKLKNIFPNVKYNNCGFLGHIAHTCTLKMKSNLVWRPKMHKPRHIIHASDYKLLKGEPKLVWVPRSNI